MIASAFLPIKDAALENISKVRGSGNIEMMLLRFAIEGRALSSTTTTEEQAFYTKPYCGRE